MEEIILTEADLEEIRGSEWGEDGELIEHWFEAGEELAKSDWIYWMDLYDDGPNRSDLLVHWLRCLLDPALPRPAVPRVIEAEPPPAPRRLELALNAR
jgi:hypothetical protein